MTNRRPARRKATRQSAARPVVDGGSSGPFSPLALSTAIFLPDVAVAIATLAGFVLSLAYGVSKLRSVIARLTG